ncbi:MAG: GAF domain-containing protein [Pelatocladus maniniholoensis HA4357-MV3]|jgi:GAF domain-containing protein|uniref:histidine kinase n=1 Tax=Pelatocladus maniniholoensis HA4357-MV3 TaxID=1117104 RepID=A0A9E3H5E0_9NOST|nr:GAF domain-containing protein [Pelatocladus maniniholoensis HA4357-MV3]BAZ69464.1 putative histidine kinase [Fischerella sp. NIES-4106]
MVADREKPEEVKVFEQEILEAENQIAQATSKLFFLEDILDNICHEIQSVLGFDFATISLVMPAHNTIETVHGIGIPKNNWFNQARHYIEEDQELRDIQADVVQTRQTEIISGWDKRFDRWLYETFHHQHFIRIFTPIILIRDETGKVIEDWFEHYDWENNFIPRQTIGGEKNTTIQMNQLPRFAVPKVIGTIEAGYKNSEIPITYKQAVTLAKLVGQKALDIRQARLPYVLEVISENARRILRADWSTLHFLWNRDQNRYVYDICIGCINNLFTQNNPPRKEGLGWQAIRDRQPQFISSSEPEFFNPTAYREGTRAYAAFPLLFDGKQGLIHREISTDTHENNSGRKKSDSSYVGVLYIHFLREHQLDDDELRWGELFANRAVDAIWHAIIYQQMRDKARQLSTLHSVTQSLNQIPENSDLLKHIAWNTLNVLAADVVTIYAYIQAEKQFLTPPSIAGRLRAEQEMSKEISQQDVPFLLIAHGKNVYAPQFEKSIFKNSPFTKRENIKSVAGVLLKVDTDIVGVMFISYRRSHSFSKEEIQIIDSLAASAAIAIKNQRWLQTLGDIDREIITTLDQEELLRLIVQRAVQITGADLGIIRHLDPISQKLVAQTRHPADEPVELNLTSIKMDEGVAGWVARHRQPALVDDVRTDSRYKAYFVNTLSELCVPLLDQDGRVVGVLNVESRKTNAFDQRDLQRLEVLADLAVIAIQNAESKEKLAKMETMAAVGDLTSQILHRMNNDVGAFKEFLQETIDSLDRGDINDARDTLNRIRLLVDRVRDNLRGMKVYKQESPQVINLYQVILEVLNQIQIPSEVIQTIDLESNLHEVFGGKQQLLGVFDNLIRNAIDAMPDGGVLSISGKSVERERKLWIELQISDTGLGISKEDREKIFQLGFTTKSNRGRMGFGLWWTQSQIESLDGHLTVNSIVGEGTQFTVILPACNPEV